MAIVPLCVINLQCAGDAYYRLFSGMPANAGFPPYPRWLGCGRCGRDPPRLLGGAKERAGGDPCCGGSCGVGGRGCPDWWAVSESTRCACKSPGSPRLIRARPSILGGSEVGPPISARIKFAACLDRDPRFRGCRLRGRHRCFSSALPGFGSAPPQPLTGGAGGAGYLPGIRRPFSWLSWSPHSPPSGTRRTGTK